MSNKKIQVIQNAIRGDQETIRVTEGDADWEAMHSAWILGKAPTASPEWKKGIISFFEDAPARSFWETDYWREGSSVYDFFMRQYKCSKCQEERTAAQCRTC